MQVDLFRIVSKPSTRSGIGFAKLNFHKKPHVIFILFIVSMFLSSCGVNSTPPQEFPELRLPSPSINSIAISIHSGSVVVGQAPGEEILLRAAADQLPDRSYVGDTLLLTRENRRYQSPVELYIPAGMALKVETDRGDILVEGVSGNLELNSIDGGIQAVNSHGTIRLRAQRGDASVSGGSGTLAALGDHGILTADRFHGTVSMSTIMGTLVYIGPSWASDEIRLETDHGPVRVNLPLDADMEVVARTNSGSKACIGVDLRQTYDGCQGVLGEGTGSLTIRTVSGRIQITVGSVTNE